MNEHAKLALYNMYKHLEDVLTELSSLNEEAAFIADRAENLLETAEEMRETLRNVLSDAEQ